jgi:hypothetical protein
MAAIPIPTLTQVRTWSVDYLDDAATHWSSSAHRWEDAYDEAYRQVQYPGGTEWTGEAADAAAFRVGTDRLQVVGAGDDLHATAAAARNSASQLDAAKQRVLEAVAEAEEAGFNVGDDYSVTSRQSGGSPAVQAARQAQAEAFAATIRARVAALLALDQQVAARIISAAAGLDTITFGEDPLVPRDEQKPSVQLVDSHAPIPERPKFEPDPPPGGWSDDPTMRAAQKIAYGHAFGEHRAKEFPGMTKNQLAELVDEMFRRNVSNPGSLLIGRAIDGAPVLYDPRTNVMVIRDVKSLDAGTVYKPTVEDMTGYLNKKVPTRVWSLPPNAFADGPLGPLAPSASNIPVEPKPAEPPARVTPPPVRGGVLLPAMPELVQPPRSVGETDLPILGSLGQEPPLREAGEAP